MPVPIPADRDNAKHRRELPQAPYYALLRSGTAEDCDEHRDPGGLQETQEAEPAHHNRQNVEHQTLPFYCC
jgi:hypothetical protein